MFRSASLFIGTSFTVAVFTIFATSNVDSIVGIPHKIYSMQRILIHIKSRSLCLMCPSAPRVCSEPGGQILVLSLLLEHSHTLASPAFCSLAVTVSHGGREHWLDVFWIYLSDQDSVMYLGICETKLLDWVQFSMFRYFPDFSELSKHLLYAWYHIRIWQVSLQLSCGHTCQIWMWFKVSNIYFY